MLLEQSDPKLWSFEDLGSQRRTLPPEDTERVFILEGNLKEEG